MERANISPGFVEDALNALRIKGIDPAPYLAAAGLPEGIGGPVTNRQYGALWLAIASGIRDEFFGLGARPMRPGAFRLMCQAMLHAGTLDQALKRGLSFLDVVLDAPTGRLRQQGGAAVIALSEPEGAPARPAFAYRAYWLIVMGVACWLIGRRVALKRLDFACPAPADRLDYRQFFGAPVRFDQPETLLVFDASYLALPLVRSETALRSFMREAPANLLVRYRHDHDIAAEVRARLEKVAPQDWPDFEAMARDLGLSPATLRRKLRADGQSFGAIKDELRSVLAQRLLKGRQSVAEVAGALGYSEPSAFHRAFLKWTGQSPGAFRRLA